MEENRRNELLKILDREEIRSKEHFLLACAAAGLDVSSEEYDDLISYEVEQLKKIGKISKMFDNQPELSLFCCKAMLHLVYSVGVNFDENSGKTLSVDAVSSNGGHQNFNMSLELMEDMKKIHSIDPDEEVWNILKAEVLKR